MFEGIYNNALQIWAERPTRGTLTIPSGNAISAIQRLWRMANWIHDEFLADCRASMGVAFPHDEEFRLRNTSRTLSYVIQISTLEKIVDRVYRDVFVSLQTYTGQTLAPDTRELNLRQQEVRSIKSFRDMIAAHTVYGSPRASDNLSLELKSLFVLLSSSTNPQNDLDSFTLGSGSIEAGGQPPSRTVPPIGIRDAHSAMALHYESWARMISGALVSVHHLLPITTADYTVRINR